MALTFSSSLQANLGLLISRTARRVGNGERYLYNIPVAWCKIQEKPNTKTPLSEAVGHRSEKWFLFFFSQIGRGKKKVCDCRICICVLFVRGPVLGLCSEAFKTHQMALSSLNHWPVRWSWFEAARWRGERDFGVWSQHVDAALPGST